MMPHQKALLALPVLVLLDLYRRLTYRLLMSCLSVGFALIAAARAAQSWRTGAGRMVGRPAFRVCIFLGWRVLAIGRHYEETIDDTHSAAEAVFEWCSES